MKPPKEERAEIASRAFAGCRARVEAGEATDREVGDYLRRLVERLDILLDDPSSTFTGADLIEAAVNAHSILLELDWLLAQPCAGTPRVEGWAKFR